MRILILGHNGMLGNAVHHFITERTDHTTLTIDGRFPEAAFTTALKSSDADCIINCIGAIPQKGHGPETYQLLNIDLPELLESTGKKIVHPSTDCEFSGAIPATEQYKKTTIRDAQDPYGASKAMISDRIENHFSNTKIIRTSIIGHELTTHLSLLAWFLNQEGQVRGYTDHYWNGITTLEWAKQCMNLIAQWDTAPRLIQLGTTQCMSKYDVLCAIRDTYEKNVEIIPFATGTPVNKCLVSDIEIQPLRDQLRELRAFYEK